MLFMAILFGALTSPKNGPSQQPAPACHWVGGLKGCAPSNEFTTKCKRSGKQCVAKQ